MHYTRREILGASTVLGFSLALGAHGQKPIKLPMMSSSPELAEDESYWRDVAAQFETDSSFINLENGFYGIMPSPIYRQYLYNTNRVNRQGSYFLRDAYKKELQAAREYLASVLRVSSDEIAITRGGTEALQNLIAGFNQLKPGDQVLYADLDYYSCQYAFNWLTTRRNVAVIKINIPEPAEKQTILDAYAQAIEENPRIKLILLTHLSNRTGLVLPVKDIAAMARQKGIDAIIDAAHSFGQLDFNINDLDADFVGLSLHKWIHAPLGIGCMYIRQNRINNIDRCFQDESFSSTDIRSRVHSGTLNVASFLTLPTALDFHLKLGARNKQERLRYLRNRWVSKVSSLDSIQVLTPNHSDMYGGMTAFRLKDRTTKFQNEEIVNYLFNKHRIFTVQREGPHKGNCVRVTPALFTSVGDIDQFALALSELLRDS